MSNKNQTVLVYLFGNNSSNKDEIMETFFKESKKGLSNVEISDNKDEYSATLKYKDKNIKLEVKDMGCQSEYLDMLTKPSAYAYVYNAYTKSTLVQFKDPYINDVKKNFPSAIKAVVGTNCDNKNHGNSGGVSENDLYEFIQKTGAVSYKVNTKKVETLDNFFIGIIKSVLGDEDEDEGNKEVKKDGKGCCNCSIY